MSAAMTTPPSERHFRAAAREWLLANTEPRTDESGFGTRFWMVSAEEEAAHHRRSGDMHRRLYEGGYVGITVPEEYGGQGGEPWMAAAFADEAADRDVSTGYYGAIVGMAVPAILAYGTDEQRREHLPPLLSGQLSWCQLFSEPGAGSDLAALATRAVRDGDELVINGQKLWSSAARFADMGILLVRTDPDAVKHAGITFLLFDMRQPGVEVRRLVQANGAGHFAEVFLTDARCPVADVLGEIDGGWAPARVVMMNESAVIGGGANRGAPVFELARLLGRSGDPTVRQRLAELHTRHELLRLMSATVAAAGRRREPPPIDPSILKLYITENRRREGDLAEELLGPAGTASTHEASEWAMELLHLRYATSIGGGTDEVHRNNLAERALGLPRDIRVDRDVPWRDVAGGRAGATG